MHVQYCQQKTNNQSQHNDLTHNTMCISSSRPPDLRWLYYEKHYKGDYLNSQIATKTSFSFYILPCGFFLLLSFFFFPRLISAIADWMSVILRHMVWPYCEFRMQVWNVLCVARWKCSTQKSPKSLHLGTIAQLCRAISSQLRHISTIGKKAC